MKTKKLYILLAAFAVVCAALGAMPGIAGEIFTGVVAFPFEQIALGLRALSLGSAGGNTAAIIIYVVVCLLPTALALPGLIRNFHREDILIPLLSIALFPAIFFMINPTLLTGSFGMSFAPMTRALLGGGCWCIILSWLLLKLARLSGEGDRSAVEKYLRICVVALAFAFTAAALYGGVSGFVAAYEKLRESNTDEAVNILPTVVFLALQAAVSALPYVLDAIVALKGVELLGALAQGRYSAESVERAEKLASFSVFSLKLTVAASLVFNLLQLVFIRKLLVVAVEAVLPLTGLAFMLAALLLSRLFRENKELKDDNDLFI